MLGLGGVPHVVLEKTKKGPSENVVGKNSCFVCARISPRGPPPGGRDGNSWNSAVSTPRARKKSRTGRTQARRKVVHAAGVPKSGKEKGEKECVCDRTTEMGWALPEVRGWPFYLTRKIGPEGRKPICVHPRLERGTPVREGWWTLPPLFCRLNQRACCCATCFCWLENRKEVGFGGG